MVKYADIKAVLYSDQIIPDTQAVDRRLLDLMEGRGKAVGYIPAAPDPDAYYLNKNTTYYAQFDLEISTILDLNGEFSGADLERLFDCDIVHLSGGNTYGFLKKLKECGLIEPLQKWACSGGILVGVSAGAMVLTPTIAVEELLDGSTNDEEMDPSALGMVPFEFFPHLSDKSNSLDRLIRYSLHNKSPIIGCPDGSGVVISSGVVECVGEAVWISNGRVTRYQTRRLEGLYGEA